jgi:uncharacterized protein with GYD domain
MATLLTKPPSIFPLGTICVTTTAICAVEFPILIRALFRHAKGDWGNLDETDQAANERALQVGGRIVSVYQYRGRERISVVTEADRSSTTILLPDIE